MRAIYAMGDIVGLGRRGPARCRTLGVIVITVNSAMRAVELLGGGGMMALAAGEVMLEADQPQIPVGIDGETVMMPTPVRCAIRPQALRVRVPRNRPGPARPSPAPLVGAADAGLGPARARGSLATVHMCPFIDTLLAGDHDRSATK